VTNDGDDQNYSEESKYGINKALA